MGELNEQWPNIKVGDKVISYAHTLSVLQANIPGGTIGTISQMWGPSSVQITWTNGPTSDGYFAPHLTACYRMALDYEIEPDTDDWADQYEIQI